MGIAFFTLKGPEILLDGPIFIVNRRLPIQGGYKTSVCGLIPVQDHGLQSLWYLPLDICHQRIWERSLDWVRTVRLRYREFAIVLHAHVRREPNQTDGMHIIQKTLGDAITKWYSAHFETIPERESIGQ